MFVSTMQSAFQGKKRDILTKELRDLYFGDAYLAVPEKSWNVQVKAQEFSS
jgi:hypothetical protein